MQTLNKPLLSFLTVDVWPLQVYFSERSSVMNSRLCHEFSFENISDRLFALVPTNIVNSYDIAENCFKSGIHNFVFAVTE